MNLRPLKHQKVLIFMSFEAILRPVFNDLIAKMGRDLPERAHFRKEAGIPFREPTASRRARCRDIGSAPIELNPRWSDLIPSRKGS